MKTWAPEAPFSNVPADKPHPPFLPQFLEKRCGLPAGVYGSQQRKLPCYHFIFIIIFNDCKDVQSFSCKQLLMQCASRHKNKPLVPAFVMPALTFSLLGAEPEGQNNRGK